MIAPQFLPLGEVVTRWTLFAATLLYCGTSFLSAYALWRVRPFALHAYYAWFVSVAIYLLVFIFLIRVPKPLGIGIAFFGLLAAFLYFGWRTVRPVFDPDAGARHE
jgi:phosphatidylserine synthase